MQTEKKDYIDKGAEKARVDEIQNTREGNGFRQKEE